MKSNSYFTKERIFYLIMTLIIAGVIFYASSIETTGGAASGLNLAAIYHFGIFFMFTFFLSLTLVNKKFTGKTVFIVLLFSLLYGLSDEFHQLFIQGRVASLKDVAVDFAGSTLSLLFLGLLDKFEKIKLPSRKRQKSPVL